MYFNVQCCLSTDPVKFFILCDYHTKMTRRYLHRVRFTRELYA